MIAPWQLHQSFEAARRLEEMARIGTHGLQFRVIQGVDMVEDYPRAKGKTPIPAGIVKDRTLELLREGPKTQMELVEAIGCGKATASKAITALRKQGLVRFLRWNRPEGGRAAAVWRIAAGGNY